MDMEEALLYLARKLEEKYGVLADVSYEKGRILLEKAGTPVNPIHNEEIDEFCRETASRFNLKTGDIAYNIHDGSIFVGFCLLREKPRK